MARRRNTEEVWGKQRESIMNAAIELFSQKGFDQTTVWEIADLVKVSDVQVLRLFGMRKENILIEIFKRYWSSINFHVISVAVDPDTNSKQKLLSLFEYIVRKLNDASNRGVMFIRESRSIMDVGQKLVGAGLADFSRLIEAIIMEGQQEGLFRSDLNLQAVRQQLMGCGESTFLGWIWNRSGQYPANYTVDDALHVFKAIIDGISVAKDEWVHTTESYEHILSDKIRMKYAPCGLKTALVIPAQNVQQDLSRLKAINADSHDGWGIQKDVVINEVKPVWRRIKSTLASAATRYVDFVLRQQGHRREIAVNWGEGMYLFAGAMESLAQQKKAKGAWQFMDELIVWPMSDIPGSVHKRYHANSIAQRIAAVYDGTSRNIDAALMHRELSSLQIAVTGMGPIPPKDDDEWMRQAIAVDEGNKLDEAVVRAAIKNGAVGEIGGLFFDREGRPVEIAKWKPMALSHADLKTMAKNGHVVLIVGGDIRKYPAVRAALRGGFASVLVTEPETAKAIL